MTITAKSDPIPRIQIVRRVRAIGLVPARPAPGMARLGAVPIKARTS